MGSREVETMSIQNYFFQKDDFVQQERYIIFCTSRGMDLRKEEEFFYPSINKQKEQRVDKNVRKFTWWHKLDSWFYRLSLFNVLHVEVISWERLEGENDIRFERATKEN